MNVMAFKRYKWGSYLKSWLKDLGLPWENNIKNTDGG